MDTSTIITSIGLAIIFIYGLTVILNFYGVNIEIYGPYISFYTFLLVCSFILPRYYKLL